MCLVCSSLNVPGGCANASCNPIVIYEGTKFTASQASGVMHFILGSVAGAVVPLGAWVRNRLKQRSRRGRSSEKD